jgi:hypothetical protein
MRNVSPDFGACLTLFAAGFVRPDNGLSSRLEISDPQEKQGKRNERALRILLKEEANFSKQCFLSTGNQPKFFQRRFPTDSRQGVSRNTFPVIPDFSVVSFSPCGAKRWWCG